MKIFKIFEVILAAALVVVYFHLFGQYSFAILLAVLPVVLLILLFRVIYAKVCKTQVKKTVKWLLILLAVYAVLVIAAPYDLSRITELLSDLVYWGLITLLAGCFFFMSCSDIEKN